MKPLYYNQPYYKADLRPEDRQVCGHLRDKLAFTVKLFLLGFTPGFYSLSFSAFCAPKTKLKRTRWRWLECCMLR